MEWKPIKGYEGFYEVSDTGEVRSVDRVRSANILHVTETRIKGKILKQNRKRNGYKTVDLSRENKIKTALVHRLVAETFIPNSDNLRFVNHKDSNRENNNVSNLEWVTAQENRMHGIESGYVAFKCAHSIMCLETGMLFERPLLAAKWVYENNPDAIKSTLRIAAQNIRGACKGRTPKAYGYTWKYHEGPTTIPEGSRGKRPEMGGPATNAGEDIV